MQEFDGYSVNQKKISTVKKYIINPVFEGIFIGIFALVLTFVTSYFIYKSSLNVLQSEIRIGLLRTVKGIASLIDGDNISFINRAEDFNDPKYQQVYKQLQKVRIGTSLSYIFITKVIDKKVYFLFDPVSVDADGKPIFSDAASQVPSMPMTLYNDADKLVYRSYVDEEALVADEPHTDKWGHLYSAYAPIYDSNHKQVGTLGVDLSIDEMLKRCIPMEDATKRAFIVSVSLALLLGTLVWFLRRFTLKLNESRQTIYKNYLIAQKFADQTSTSIGKQFQRTSSILKHNAERLKKLCEDTDKEQMIKRLNLEQENLEKFSDKLLTLGNLKFSIKKNELANFSVREVNDSLIKNFKNYSLNNNLDNRLSFTCKEDVPINLYGAVMSYEELLGHLYEFFLRFFEKEITSTILMLDERSNDVLLRQEFKVSLEGLAKEKLTIIDDFSKNIAETDWTEQLHLLEFINIPIIQELLYMIDSKIDINVNKDIFILQFDFVLLKCKED